jgi:hypothetical protein
MESEDFLLRVRGAGETRLFRIRGAQAAELHRLRGNGTLERPGGSHRLQQLIREIEPESVTASVSSIDGDVHFEMVAEDELRQYMSSRLAERKAGREAGSPGPQSYPGDRPNDPSPA